MAQNIKDNPDEFGIYDRMRKLMRDEGRRPPACAPGKHDFVYRTGDGYVCSYCEQGREQDGR